MRIRNLVFMSSIAALVSAQAVAQPLPQQRATRIDPLLALSILSSQQSRSVSCGLRSNSDGSTATNSGNCEIGREGEQPGASPYDSFVPPAKGGGMLALSETLMFAYGLFIALTFAEVNPIIIRGPVSPA